MLSPLLVTAVLVVAAVWWSDVVVDPIRGVDRRLSWTSCAVSVLVALFVARRLRRVLPLVVLVLMGIAFGRGVVEWSVQTRTVDGRVDAVVRVVEDPEFRGRGVRIVVDDGRDRLEAYAYGSVGRRLSRVSAGEMIDVVGSRRSFDSSSSRRRLLRHVTGRLDIEAVDVRPLGVERTGGGLDRAANRVRDSLEHGARVLPAGDRALLLGFLVGDDRFQSWETISAFRESGLAHLTAVSGQNVAFVLAIVSPLVSRLSRGARVSVTIVVLAWFAVLTRAEPSVVRAVFMAGAATIGSVLEWRRRGLDVLCLAVVLGAIVDPFLVWSIGWWLSIGGCVGLAVIAPRVERTLRSGRVAAVVSPTIGAQLGVLPVSALVFGWPSAWSVPCNVLAGPVAGLAMLVGLPVTLFSSFLPDSAASIVMAPVLSAVRWVDTVARLGAMSDVPGWVDAAVAILVPVALILLGRQQTAARGNDVATSAYERSPRPRR
ncbi:MAG: putative competence protein ComEC [Actinomycetota bacterium]